MKKWLLPIRILLLFLGAMTLLASFAWNGASLSGWAMSAQNLAILYLSSLATFWLLGKAGLARPTLWEHRAISCFILFLLFDSLFPWWFFFGLGLVTELLQRLIRLPGGPLFNPAALGALIASILGFYPTWWGTNFPPRLPILGIEVSAAFFLTALVAGYVAHRYKKLPIALTGLVSFCLAYFLIFQANPFPIALEGTLLFYLLVMAVEPKTSPADRKEQYLYGGLIGILVPLGFWAGFPESYLIALLLSNLYKSRKALKSALDSILFSPQKQEPTAPSL